jgi:hypothetical protein
MSRTNWALCIGSDVERSRARRITWAQQWVKRTDDEDSAAWVDAASAMIVPANSPSTRRPSSSPFV